MRRRLVAGAITAAAAVVFVLSSGSAAWAYFTSSGSGAASASIGNLGAPSISGAVPSAGSVTLTWTTVSPPTGVGPVTYVVRRDGGSSGGDCPTPSSPAAATSCTDTGLAAGTYAYTVTAVWRTWTATSAAADATVDTGAATKLAFTTQPGGGVSGGAWAQQPVVTVQDAAGNTVTSSSASVTLTIATQPGSGATLGCTTNPLGASSGVASFSGCRITGTAGSHTLSASSPGLTSATSASFTITEDASRQIALTGSAADLASDVTRTFTATIQDGSGATVTTGPDSSASVTFSQTGGSGSVTGLGSVTASGGVATITVTGNLAGSVSVQASATLSGSSVTSNALAFSVTPGAASKLAFSTQPGGGPSGSAWAQQPVVTVQDAAGNTVAGSSATVTLSIASQPGSGATLGCTTNPLDASSGVASFSGCRITGLAGSYTLSATSPGLTSATSASFTITGKLHVGSLVTGATSGATTWGGSVTVTVRDANDAPVADVAVTGTWSPTSAATPSGCTTNAAGQCTITTASTSFPSTQLTESWTVTNLSATDHTYDAAANTVSSITLSRGCAAGAVCATNVGTAWDTGNTSSTSVTLSGANGTAPNNSTVLIVVARDGSLNNDAITSVTGSAIGSPTLVRSITGLSSSPSAFTTLWAYRAVGTGTPSGTVTVTFSNLDNRATLVQVLVLSGNDTSSPIAQSTTNTGNSSTAVALLSGPSSGNAEIVLVGQARASGSAMSTPAGWTQLSWNNRTGANGANYGTYYGPSAVASQTFTLGTSGPWGTIALEIRRST